MSTVFYGLAGEGRGHATRARTVVEGLRDLGHRVVVFAPDLAYELLAPTFADSNVRVERIDGLRFGYDGRGRVSVLGTMAATARFAHRLKERVGAVLPIFEREKPDLVIADFEPILPRAARMTGVPFVSFDHQHYLVVNDLSALPFSLRRMADLCAPAVRALYDWQIETIVSSFYAPPVKPRFTNVTQVGVLLRPELLAARPERRGHLLVYMRRFATPGLFDALSATGMPVRFYGLGARPAEGRIQFLPVDEQTFMHDLAGCEAVISTAGNQLVGEALYLRKPVLAIPEPHNFEQAINGHFLTASGGGMAVPGALSMKQLFAFLADLDSYRSRIMPERIAGNRGALVALTRHLGDPVAIKTAFGPRTRASGAPALAAG